MNDSDREVKLALPASPLALTSGAEVDGDDTTVIRLPAKIHDSDNWLTTSLDLVRSRDQIFRLLSLKDRSLGDYEGTEILVTDAIVHVVELEDRASGEILQRFRTVLVATDGHTYSCVAAGVFDVTASGRAKGSLPMLCSPKFYGPMPWVGGRPVVPVRQKTSAGFFTLKIVPPAPQGALGE